MGGWVVKWLLCAISSVIGIGGSAFDVPAAFFEDPSRVEDSWDGVKWLNRMVCFTLLYGLITVSICICSNVCVLVRWKLKAIKAQLDAFSPSRLPIDVHFPCPKDQALLKCMGLAASDFQQLVVLCPSGDALVAKLKAKIGLPAYARLKLGSDVATTSGCAPSNVTPSLRPRFRSQRQRQQALTRHDQTRTGVGVPERVVVESATCWPKKEAVLWA